MRLVRTSARGENSMDVESFSLLESDSTMPHRGIALPPLTWYFCIDFCRAVQSTNTEWITIHPRPPSTSSSPFYQPLLTLVCSSKLMIALVYCCVYPPSSPPIPSHRFRFASTRMLLSVIFCVLIIFGLLGIFIHRRFLTGPLIVVWWFRICWGRPRGGIGNETK